MLIRTGALRRGLRSRIDGTRLIYSNSVPYAGIHNYGGRIKQDFVPSTQMRRWAWAQYHETKNEKFRQMAFVGDHPRVHELVAEVVSNRLRIEREQGVIAQELQRFNSKT